MSLFGGLVPTKSTLLAPGGSDPRRIVGRERQKIDRRVMLPAKVSTQSVLNASGQAAEAKKQAFLLQVQSRQELATMRSALQAYTTRLSHSQQAMAAIDQYQKAGVRHQEALYKYNLNTGINQRQIAPWDEAIASANQLFDF